MSVVYVTISSPMAAVWQITDISWLGLEKKKDIYSRKWVNVEKEIDAFMFQEALYK